MGTEDINCACRNGLAGAVSLRPQAPVEWRTAGQQTIGFAPDWRAHFAGAYVNQLQAWVDAIRTGMPLSVWRKIARRES